jgi:hypothetical protein
MILISSDPECPPFVSLTLIFGLEKCTNSRPAMHSWSDTLGSLNTEGGCGSVRGQASALATGRANGLSWFMVLTRDARLATNE